MEGIWVSVVGGGYTGEGRGVEGTRVRVGGGGYTGEGRRVE